MCQKQFGSVFGAFVNAPGGVEWTRETPSWFQSSVNIERGFCARCGTPLVYRNPVGIDIALGATCQVGMIEIQAAKLLEREGNDRGLRLCTGAVKIHTDCIATVRPDAVRNFLRPISHEITNDHMSTFVRKTSGRCGTDASAATGDDPNLAGQPSHAFLPLFA